MRPLSLCPLLLPLLCACLSTEPPLREAGPSEGVPHSQPEVLPQHRGLEGLAGDWRVEVEGQDSQAVGAGTAVLSSLHGGRILRLELKLSLEGQATHMTGHLGYDGESGLWQAIWFSDASTEMSLLEGRGELGTGVHFIGERRGIRGRSVLTVPGPDTFTVEAYIPAAGGGDLLLRRSSYVRM